MLVNFFVMALIWLIDEMLDSMNVDLIAYIVVISSVWCDITCVHWLLNYMMRHVKVMMLRSFLTSVIMSRSFLVGICDVEVIFDKCYGTQVIFGNYFFKLQKFL